MLRITATENCTGYWVPGHFIPIVSDATRDAERRAIQFHRAMTENAFCWRAFVRFTEYRRLVGF